MRTAIADAIRKDWLTDKDTITFVAITYILKKFLEKISLFKFKMIINNIRNSIIFIKSKVYINNIID